MVCLLCSNVMISEIKGWGEDVPFLPSEPRCVQMGAKTVYSGQYWFGIGRLMSTCQEVAVYLKAALR